jgi:hypothetical protein
MSCRKILTKVQLADLNWTQGVFFAYFLCDKESRPRASAEKIPGFSNDVSFARAASAAHCPQDRRMIVKRDRKPENQKKSLACGSG